jgi:hypothetical protein
MPMAARQRRRCWLLVDVRQRLEEMVIGRINMHQDLKDTSDSIARKRLVEDNR